MALGQYLRQSGAGQNLAIGAASVPSTAAPASIFVVRLTASGNCHIKIGPATPVAVATDLMLKSTDPSQYLAISPGEEVAVIQDGAATGTLNVTWMTQ